MNLPRSNLEPQQHLSIKTDRWLFSIMIISYRSIIYSYPFRRACLEFRIFINWRGQKCYESLQYISPMGMANYFVWLGWISSLMRRRWKAYNSAMTSLNISFCFDNKLHLPQHRGEKLIISIVLVIELVTDDSAYLVGLCKSRLFLTT